MNWRVQVLGRLALSQGARSITHFESSRAASLLARLALYAHRAHAREELLELLWPEIDPEISRPRLRQTLYSLRHQLEPPGTPPGSILIAGRHDIRLNADACECDAAEFERLARQGRIEEARLLYAGDLMPGFYDEWILAERERLAQLYERLSPDAALRPAPAITPAAPIMPAAPAAPAGRLLPAAASQAGQHKEEARAGVVSLPGYLAPLLGRETEQAQLCRLLAAHRLVTLTGLGGVGKTRLAVSVAGVSARDYDTTVFVGLAECASPAQIPEAIRAALHLPASSTPTLDQIATVLHGQRALLVLDNFEQLVAEGGAVVLEMLMTRLPELSCLVTSRRVVGVAGEQEFPLAPFPLPDARDTLAELARNPGVALFTRRAQAARPGFHLTDANRAHVLSLCHALDGIPLALELAAGRIRALSAGEMTAQIQTRFEWLAYAGPGADKQPRQRSLRAALDWSWRLLSPSQARFCAALTVFRGGWTADMAAQVCAMADARERLEALTMESLIVSEETESGATRFQMLQTVRDFARERLDAEQADMLAARHRRAFLALAEGANRRYAALLPDAQNFVAALEAAVASHDADCAFALCAAIDDGWMVLTSIETSLPLLRRALQLRGGAARDRIRALHTASYLALVSEQTTLAHELAEEAMDAAGDNGAARALALCVRCAIAVSLYAPGDSIDADLREAVLLARQFEEPRCEALLYKMQGICAKRRDEDDEANRCFHQALALFQSLNDVGNVIYTRDCMANLAMKRDDTTQALALYEQCQAQGVEIGDAIYGAKVWQNLATVYARQERWQMALTAGQEAIRRNQAVGNGYILAFALWNIPEPLAFLGKCAPAAQIMGFIRSHWVQHYGPLDDDDREHCAQVRAISSQALGDAQTDTLFQQGELLTLSQAIALALTPSAL